MDSYLFKFKNSSLRFSMLDITPSSVQYQVTEYLLNRISKTLGWSIGIIEKLSYAIPNIPMFHSSLVYNQ